MWGSKNKFRAGRIESCGESFASKLEAAVYALLKLMERAGEIEILSLQDHVKLTNAGILYIPDFKCLDKKTGSIFWVEAKGFETDVWRIKRRLWQHYGPGDLHVYKGSYARPVLHEVIKSKLAL